MSFLAERRRVIMNRSPLLEVNDLKVYYGSDDRQVRAVDGVSLRLAKGQCLGLVGESGCGKSTLGRAILRLEPIHSGQVHFNGVDITSLRGADLKAFRRKAQMVFQDPYGSLNPRMSIGRCIEEVLDVHRIGAKEQRMARVRELLEAVGLDPAYAGRYPHEFSGGQRQRIGIARALAVEPELIIADEPVSALDVSVQVQILNLLKDLQQKMNLTYLFVAHDLAVVRYICSDVVVMYLGRIMESGPSEEVYRQPAHPYTVALLSAVPDVDRALKARRSPAGNLRGDVPSVSGSISGCPFHPRCPRAEARCREEAPVLRTVGTGGRCSACHFAEEFAGRSDQ
jgi:oligopeptide/dipeptide ABC transporter ATP-binding protein